MAAELPVTDDEMIASCRAEYERLSSTAEGPHACFRYIENVWRVLIVLSIYIVFCCSRLCSWKSRQ